MTRSTGKRKFSHKRIIPKDPAIQPYHEWPIENREFLDRFRTWLVSGGYSQSTLGIYSAAVRLALGYIGKPYQQIDIVSDLEQVSSHMLEQTLSPATIQDYKKGLAKLEEYLLLQDEKPTRRKFRPPERGSQETSVPDINWEYYTRSLPDWLIDDLHAYLRHCRRNWRPESQHRLSYEIIGGLTKFLRWAKRHTKLDSIDAITPELWNRFVEARQKSGISNVTLNSDLIRIKSFLRFLEEEGREICYRMKLVRAMPEEPHTPKDVPVEQVRKILAEIGKEIQKTDPVEKRMGLMDKAWYLLMLHGGLRTCEVRFLCLQDIDWDNRRLKIELSKGFKERMIYLSDEALTALKVYLTVRGTAADGCGDRVFLYRHKTLSSRYCQERLLTYGKKCKVRITPHQLRFTCATLMLNAGIPVAIVQTILGHKHVDTTLGYARVNDTTIETEYNQATNSERVTLFNNLLLRHPSCTASCH